MVSGFGCWSASRISPQPTHSLRRTSSGIGFRFLASWLLGLVALVAHGQSADFQKEAALLKKTLDQNHIRPPVLDDAFSHAVVESLLAQLDPYHLYFSQDDVSALRQFDHLLDDEWKGQGWQFLPQLTTRYRLALVHGVKILEEEAQQPINGAVAESFLPKGNALPWSATEVEQRNRWRSWIKYKALMNVRRNSQLDSMAAAGGNAYFKSQEASWRKQVLTVESRRVKRILQNPNGFEDGIAATYFRQVAAWYDPHSLYLAPSEYEKFKEGVTTKAFAFGFNLGEDEDGNILIQRLQPGGPAWKAGIHQGDILLDISWEGQAPFDLTGIGLSEFLDLLDTNPPSAWFSVRDRSGVQRKLFIRKEKITNDDNTVRGFVLNGEKKVGYISLPGFYTEWDESEKSSCANDVASEIMKLKGEGIEALILDIRFNGGGSLMEAVGMGGIFIDEGSMAMISEKDGTIISLRDFSRGVVYGGPLLLMVNGQSASASELVAAALQDYHRAIIVGSPTYGKATGQQVIPLDTLQRKAKGKPATGVATVTEMRIYRVTGKSNQGTGLIPDVRLPDLTELPGYHESDNPRAFTKDSTLKKSYFKPLRAIPLEAIQQKSLTRTNTLEEFSRIRSWLNDMKLALQDTVPVVLSRDQLPDMRSLRKGLEVTNDEVPFTVTVPEFNKLLMEVDSYRREQTVLLEKILARDPWVRETFRVAIDYINLK